MTNNTSDIDIDVDNLLASMNDSEKTDKNEKKKNASLETFTKTLESGLKNINNNNNNNNNNQNTKNNNVNNNSTIFNTIYSYKNILIYIILFILLSLINLPYITKIENLSLQVIYRSLIFGIIIFILVLLKILNI